MEEGNVEGMVASEGGDVTEDSSTRPPTLEQASSTAAAAAATAAVTVTTADISTEDSNGGTGTNQIGGGGSGGDTVASGATPPLTSKLYISNTKKLYNDFLVNFFPLHVSYWREMKWKNSEWNDRNDVSIV